jgi:hypothetical protein
MYIVKIPIIAPDDIVINGTINYKLLQVMAFFGYSQKVKSSATPFGGADGSNGAYYTSAQIRVEASARSANGSAPPFSPAM